MTAGKLATARACDAQICTEDLKGKTLRTECGHLSTYDIYLCVLYAALSL